MEPRVKPRASRPRTPASQPSSWTWGAVSSRPPGRRRRRRRPPRRGPARPTSPEGDPPRAIHNPQNWQTNTVRQNWQTTSNYFYYLLASKHSEKFCKTSGTSMKLSKESDRRQAEFQKNCFRWRGFINWYKLISNLFCTSDEGSQQKQWKIVSSRDTRLYTKKDTWIYTSISK